MNAGNAKTAIYVRVSKSDGSQTTANQLRELNEYAARMGYQTVVYKDQESGSHSDRDGLKALLHACSRRQVSRVLFWRLDRITSLGAREAHNFFHSLDTWNIAYKSLTESWLDSEGPVTMIRDILISVVATFANQERETLILRTKAGLARARAEGKMLGRPRVLGSKGHVGDLERIKKLHRQGKSQRQIAEILKLSKGTVQRAWKPIRMAQDAPGTHWGTLDNQTHRHLNAVRRLSWFPNAGLSFGRHRPDHFADGVAGRMRSCRGCWAQSRAALATAITRPSRGVRL